MPDGELIALRMKLLGGKEVAAETDAVTASQKRLRDETGRFTKESVKSSKTQETAATKAASANARLAKTATSLRTTGHALTKYVSLPMIALGAYSIKTALDFNKSMSLVQTQAGASAHELRFLETGIKSLAASGKTGFTDNELAEAMYAIRSAGIKGAKALVTLKSASDFAEVGQANLAETTKALVSAQNTGIRGTHNLNAEMGTLNATIGAGQMHMSDLNGALSTGFLGSAKALGLNLTEVGGALAFLTREGTPANSAATRLRMAFSLIANPTTKAVTSLNEIGLTQQALALKMRGPNGAVEAFKLLNLHLKEHFDLSTKAGKVAATQTLAGAFGGAKSGGTILQLIGNMPSLEAATEAVAKNTGKITADVRKAESTGQEQLKHTWSQFNNALVELGQTLIPVVIPALRDLVEVATAGIHAFAGLPGPIQDVALGVGALAALAGPMLLFAASVLKAAKTLGLLSTVSGGGLLSPRGVAAKGMLLRGAVGIGGTIAAQSAGNAIGGDAGNWVSDVGTGASTGFMLGGPMGAAVGGAIGGVAAAYSKVSGELKVVSFEQRRLVGSGKDVVNFMGQQRSASMGLTSAEHRVAGALKRRKTATDQLKTAQRHLSAVVSEYGPHSRAAIHAEARLTGLTDAHRKAIRQLQNAEHLRGVALSAYKTATDVTILAERHRISVLSELRDRQAKLYTQAKQANPQSEKTRNLANNLLGTEKNLSKAVQQHSQTLGDAAAKGGQAYAKFLQHANQESVRAGGSMKALNLKAERLTTTLKGLAELEVTVPSIHGPHGGRHHPGHNAAGTNWWRGGETYLAERGPELVNLPRGSSVLPAPATRRALGDLPAARIASEAGGGGQRLLAPIIVKVGRKVLAEVQAEVEADAKARL